MFILVIHIDLILPYTYLIYYKGYSNMKYLMLFKQIYATIDIFTNRRPKCIKIIVFNIISLLLISINYQFVQIKKRKFIITHFNGFTSFMNANLWIVRKFLSGGLPSLSSSRYTLFVSLLSIIINNKYQNNLKKKILYLSIL